MNSQKTKVKVDVYKYTDFDTVLLEISFLEPLILSNGDTLTIKEHYLSGNFKIEVFVNRMNPPTGSYGCIECGAWNLSGLDLPHLESCSHYKK